MAELKNALEDQYSVRDIAFGTNGLKLCSIRSGDDQGLCVQNGQFTVGTPDSPQESVFGSGDSYPVTIAFHFDYANLSGTTITGATPVTSILQSDSDSATGLFGGIVSGKALLVGSAYNFGGVKIKYDSSGDVDPDNVTLEYLQDSSPTWVSAPWMVTQSNETYQSYAQYANRIGASGATSEQLRVGFNPLSIPTSWDTVELTINGVAYGYKWAVIRLTGAIVEDPSVQQIKLHTNRFEVNADGDSEFFGLSRPPFTISRSIDEWVSTGAAPSDEDITYSTNITIARTGNEFLHNADDSLGTSFKVEAGIDTSLPFIVNIFWYPLGTSTGDDVRFHLFVADIPIGGAMDGSISDTEYTTEYTVNGQQYELIKSTFIFYLPKTEVGDTIALKLERQGTSDSSDTYGSNIVVENINIRAFNWK